MPIIALTEKSNPDTSEIDLMSALEIADTINREDQKIAIAISKELDSIGQAIEIISQAFNNGGRLAYFGAGTSGRIGILDASEMPPTYGVSAELIQAFIAGGDNAIRHGIENAEDSTEFALEDLTTFNPQPNDVVTCISASGNPAYVVTIPKEAKKLGIKTIAITSNPQAMMKEFADIFICPLVGPEAVTGSSRMKSGTAQKMVLNMLTTGAMIRIGKTYHNHMVDLSISNQKLYDRACRIVSEITDIGYDEAQQYIEASSCKVKTACVMASLNCSKEQAENLLRQHSGILRKII